MIFEPSSLTTTFVEGVGTTGTTVTVTDNQGQSVGIKNVTCSEPIEDLMISIGTSRFTFSSTFDVMEREIRYTVRSDAGNTYGTVSKISNLPAKYDLHQVTSAPESKVITFLVTLNTIPVDTTSWQLTVESDANRTIQLVREAITGSQGRQEYLASRPGEPEQF